MGNKNYVRVALNEKGWEIYREANAYGESNRDKEGYSIFSYDYFEKLFYPLPHAEFSTDVQAIDINEVF